MTLIFSHCYYFVLCTWTMFVVLPLLFSSTCPHFAIFIVPVCVVLPPCVCVFVCLFFVLLYHRSFVASQCVYCVSVCFILMVYHKILCRVSLDRIISITWRGRTLNHNNDSTNKSTTCLFFFAFLSFKKFTQTRTPIKRLSKLYSDFSMLVFVCFCLCICMTTFWLLLLLLLLSSSSSSSSSSPTFSLARLLSVGPFSWTTTLNIKWNL